MSKLIPETEPVPLDHWAEPSFDVPAIPINEVAAIRCDPIDVTTFASGFRQSMPGSVTLVGANGDELFCGSREIAKAAIEGGGRYRWIHLNPMYDEPLTAKEYEAILDADAEAQADYDW